MLWPKAHKTADITGQKNRQTECPPTRDTPAVLGPPCQRCSPLHPVAVVAAAVAGGAVAAGEEVVPGAGLTVSAAVAGS